MSSKQKGNEASLLLQILSAGLHMTGLNLSLDREVK